MPIHVGADNIEPVSIGKVAITSGYVGADKVYGYDPIQILTLTSAEDFNLKTFLDSSGADYLKPIIINMASDQVIGGVADHAFTIAGLPTHSTITININGQIQGRVSGDAVVSDESLDVVNAGQVSGGISAGLDESGSLITFVISSTGKVLGGGGNGGSGGRGGDGSNMTSVEGPIQHDDGPIKSQWVYYNTSNIRCWWMGTDLGIPPNGTRYWNKSGKWYWAGQNTGSGGFYYISRGNLTSGSGGSGGIAGVGAGYGQARTDGANGVTGTYRSGNGGKGGNGGDWGASGATGESGGTGLYYSSTSANNTRSGATGIVGDLAGMAFYLSSSTVRYYGVDSPQARALNL